MFIDSRERGGRKWQETLDSIRGFLQRSREPSLIIEDGRFVDCNRAALGLLGLESKGQILGIHPSDCSPLRQPDGRLSAERADEMIAYARCRGSCQFEWHHLRKGAATVPVEVVLTKYHVDGREALYTAWRDLTHQKSLQAALRESEALFREVFEQSEDAIILLDPSTWCIVDANPSALRQYGYPKQSLREMGIGLFMEPTECERFMDAVRLRNLEGGTRLEGCCHTAHDGKKLFVSAKCRPVTFHSKILLYCRFRDVTDEIRVQQETKRIQDKLIHANKMASLGVLVSSVAHEINNPNNFIMLNSSLLQEAWVDAVRILEDYTKERGDVNLAGLPFLEMKDAIGRLVSGVIDGSRRINGIVDSLKEFSRQSPQPRKEPIDVNRTIRMGTTMLGSHIRKFTDGFVLDLDEGIPLVLGNGQQLEQVIINLVLNALQALPDKGRGVRVVSRFEKDTDSVVIRIEDEGNGMPADVLDRIREPFFSTKLDSGGTGLGVYISHSIVQDHKGSLRFESSEEHGTTAIITLPSLSERM